MAGITGVIVAIVIIVSSVFIHQKVSIKKTSVLGNAITPTSTPSPTISDTPTMTPERTIPLQTTNTPAPTSKTAVSANISIFIYPNAQQSNRSDSSVSLTSNDNPSDITNWYENVLATNNFHSKSEAKTNTNGNVLNKLAASNGSYSVAIEIKKSASDAQTNISVTLTQQNNSNVTIHIQNSY